MEKLIELLGCELDYCIINERELSHIIFYRSYKPYNKLGKGYLEIDAYYPASNILYHKVKRMRKILQDNGYGIINKDLLLKPLAQSAGLGKILYNQLLTSKPFGSKLTLQALTIEGKYSKPMNFAVQNNCSLCKKCEKACPNKALIGGQFVRSNCIRDMQERAEVDFTVLENRLLGCDECQRACPYNAKIDGVDCPEELKNLLKIETLLDMCAKGRKGLLPLAEWIGVNYTNPKWVFEMVINCLIATYDFNYHQIIKQIDKSNVFDASNALNEYFRIYEIYRGK